MSNRHTTLASLFNDIANAIRQKTGSSATLVADDFDTAISNIQTGGAPIEIGTSPAMDAVLVDANIGKYYLYNGTTDTKYNNGHVYKVEQAATYTITVNRDGDTADSQNPTTIVEGSTCQLVFYAGSGNKQVSATIIGATSSYSIYGGGYSNMVITLSNPTENVQIWLNHDYI